MLVCFASKSFSGHIRFVDVEKMNLVFLLDPDKSKPTLQANAQRPVTKSETQDSPDLEASPHHPF